MWVACVYVSECLTTVPCPITAAQESHFEQGPGYDLA